MAAISGDERLKFFASLGMAKLVQRFQLDLTNALPSEVELTADLLQEYCVGSPMP